MMAKIDSPDTALSRLKPGFVSSWGYPKVQSGDFAEQKFPKLILLEIARFPSWGYTTNLWFAYGRTSQTVLFLMFSHLLE
jgi:hypothetical protein